MSTSLPVFKGPLEKKVTWSAVGTYLGGVALLAVLQVIGADPSLVSGMPDWLEAIVMPLIPGAISFLSGFSAKHTPRPDLGEAPQEGVIRGGVIYGDDPPESETSSGPYGT